MTKRSSTRAMLGFAMLALLSACSSGSSSASDGGDVIVQPQPHPSAPASILAAITGSAQPITGADTDYSDIIGAAAEARRVLLGESTHGTSEYYRERGRITEQLIVAQGVNAITIEGDWSPTFRLNLYVRGLGSDGSATEALQGFTARFPRWMWRNVEFRDFAERLRTINMTRPFAQRVGIYGMDVYDLFGAADQVVGYLQERYPERATRIRNLYACFRSYGRSAEAYGQAMVTRSDTCRDEAEAAVAELASVPRPPDPEQAEYHFGAARAAASVAAAEAYYRVSYGRGSENPWNLRDRGMADALESVASHAQAQSGNAGKTVSWSHNTHTGNAAATDGALRGETSLGQLMRERHGDAALLVGFFSHSGSVFAAPEWGAEGRIYAMTPALSGSHSDLFHQTGLPAFSLLLRGKPELSALRSFTSQRAIGVVYQSQTEVQSHYFKARLTEQFDAAVFFNQSRALIPL